MRDEVANQAGPIGETAGRLGGFESAKREKTWDECGIEEKVERLRRVMRDQQHMIRAGWNTAHAANELARQHQHNSVTGEVLAAVNRGNMAGESIGRSFDPLA